MNAVEVPAEAAALQWFLDAQRRSVLDIVDGLSDEQLTTSVMTSGWTPVGLIEHLGHAERHWFSRSDPGFRVAVALGS